MSVAVAELTSLGLVAPFGVIHGTTGRNAILAECGWSAQEGETREADVTAFA